MTPPTADSPSSSSSAATATTTASSVAASNPNPISTDSAGNGRQQQQSWWEPISKARARIHALSDLLPSASHLPFLADSDRPALSLLGSPDAYSAISAALSLPSAGSGDDPLCHWLYDTFLSADPDLRLVVLSFLPLLAGLYLHRVLSPIPTSLAGFEAVLLAVYGAEAQSRAGKPLLVSVPDLSLPSLYHSPRPQPRGGGTAALAPLPSVGILSPPLEPHRVVKSTKRASIVAVALDSYYTKIFLMPSRSKTDLCDFVASWAGQDCPCRYEFDTPLISSSSSPEIHSSEEDGEIGNGFSCLQIHDHPNGQCSGEADSNSSRPRVPLPWELLQPVLRILGHCLLAPLNPQEVRDAASRAVRCVYARASHDLLSQAILSTRSLIQLDIARRAAKVAAVAAGGLTSNPNTPSKLKKPEVFLASK